MEELEKRRKVEVELEKTMGELYSLQSEFARQRSESESMKRNLESEREAHKLELTNAQKHADSLSTDVSLLKKQLGHSNTNTSRAQSLSLSLIALRSVIITCWLFRSAERSDSEVGKSEVL